MLAVGMAVVASAWTLGMAPAGAAEPVQPTIVRDVPGARGTVVLVHGGGWAGADRERQWDLDWWPGTLFRESGWNTASVDFPAGKAGLRSVVDEIAAATARAPRRRVCVYGESAGGHLALLAAAQLPRLRCVIGLGVPTDLERWREDATREARTTSLTAYSQTAGRTFGYGDIEDAWQPVAQADQIRGRVLLIGQADDQVLPIWGQLSVFDDARPATELLVTEAGKHGDHSQRYLHGTFSPAGRAQFEQTLRSFVNPPRLLPRAADRRPCRGCSTRG